MTSAALEAYWTGLSVSSGSVDFETHGSSTRRVNISSMQ